MAKSAKQYGLMASALGGNLAKVKQPKNETPAKKRSLFTQNLLKKKKK